MSSILNVDLVTTTSNFTFSNGMKTTSAKEDSSSSNGIKTTSAREDGQTDLSTEVDGGERVFDVAYSAQKTDTD